MDTFFMNTFLDPLLGILGILVPLAFAYVIIKMQSRNPDRVHQESHATKHHDSQCRQVKSP